MSCPNCTISAQEIVFDFSKHNQNNFIAIVSNHLERQHIQVKVKGQHLHVNEQGAMDLHDFCVHHSEMENISFRIGEQPWRTFVEFEQYRKSAWIDHVIQEERIINHFQAIVTAEKIIYGYELLARFIDQTGEMIYPDVIFSAAKQRGRLFALDRLCRLTAVKNTAQIDPTKKAFINFIPTAIYAPEFCLRSTINLANQLNINCAQLVFEVVETEQVEDVDHLKRILNYYQLHGFHYALDDVGEGYSTIEMLTDISPDYMKLGRKYVDRVVHNDDKKAAAIRFLNKAKEIGATPLAEGVETEEDFLWLKQNGYQLFQGYLFGKPIKDQSNKTRLTKLISSCFSICLLNRTVSTFPLSRSNNLSSKQREDQNC